MFCIKFTLASPLITKSTNKLNIGVDQHYSAVEDHGTVHHPEIFKSKYLLLLLLLRMENK